MSRALVIVDDRVEPGVFQVGGCCLLPSGDESLIGFAVQARSIRVHDEEAARDLELYLRREGHETRRLPA